MSETDNPLKVLITQFAEVFAAWLLGRNVRSIRPLNVEFPANPIRSDLLFEVIDQQGQTIYLHIEMQGRSSHQPMPYRELRYMSQTIMREIELPFGPDTPHLHSVVMYVGEGAGRDDKGQYTIYGSDGRTKLYWEYDVIRLWQMSAKELFDLGNPAFLALIGQTQLENPAVVLPQALSSIRTIKQREERNRLLTALVSLLPTVEVIDMVEKMLEGNETLLLNTPYLQRIRQLGREEAIREAILQGITRKFRPEPLMAQQIAQTLETIHSVDALQQILLFLLDAANVDSVIDKIAKTADST